MRIAFYAPLKSPNHPVPSGDRRVARLLMDALLLAGHEVELVRITTKGDVSDAPLASLGGAGGVEVLLDAGASPDPVTSSIVFGSSGIWPER